MAKIKSMRSPNPFRKVNLYLLLFALICLPVYFYSMFQSTIAAVAIYSIAAEETGVEVKDIQDAVNLMKDNDFLQGLDLSGALQAKPEIAEVASKASITSSLSGLAITFSVLFVIGTAIYGRVKKPTIKESYVEYATGFIEERPYLHGFKDTLTIETDMRTASHIVKLINKEIVQYAFRVKVKREKIDA